MTLHLTHMTVTQFNRLPKYAQDEIQHLNLIQSHTDARVSQLEDKDKGSQRVKYRKPNNIGMEACAPAENFRFLLGTREHERVDISLDESGGHVYINGGDRLMIVPEASNSCRIYVGRK